MIKFGKQNLKKVIIETKDKKKAFYEELFRKMGIKYHIYHSQEDKKKDYENSSNSYTKKEGNLNIKRDRSVSYFRRPAESIPITTNTTA